MKMKYLIIVGLILAILTMGAVSASEDVDLDDVSANDEGVDVEEAPAEDVTDEIIGTDYEDDEEFEVSIEDDVDLDEEDSIMDIYIDADELEGNFSISVDQNDGGSWVINHKITQDNVDEGCEFTLEDLQITEAGTYSIGVKFIPINGEAKTLVTGHELTVNDVYEPPAIEFNAEFYIDDESFVVVQLPYEYTDGRIIVYVDDVESFNKTLDEFDPYTAGDGSMLAYVVGFKNLTCEINSGSSYNFKVEVYVDGNLYASEDIEEYVNSDSGEKEEVDYDYDIPERVRMDDEYPAIYIYIPNKDITGNVTITIGDKLVYNQEIDPYYWDEDIGGYVGTGNKFYLNGLDLPQGEYDVVISYAGDEKYEGFTIEEELFYYFIDVDNSGEIYSYFTMDIAEDATGNVELFINGTSFKNMTAAEAYDGLDLSDLPYGKYNYTIYYRDDEKYALDGPLEGEFERTYVFRAYMYDTELFLGDRVSFDISTPIVGEATIIIRYNGKVTNRTVYDGELYYSTPVLTVGENIIYFTYVSDKYPERTINMTFDVEPKVIVKEDIRYHNDEDAISILLPEDAVGNMVIYIQSYNETSYEYEWDVLASVAVKDGRANYTVDLPLGSYVIKVNYTGKDYEDYFDDDEMYIAVIPDIDVPRGVYINATNVITVVLPDDGKDNLTVTIRDENYDGNVIYDAVANGTKTITIPKLEVGGYYVSVEYGDYSNGYYMDVKDIPPEFELNVVFPSEVSSYNKVISISGVPSDAYGYLELYVDGELYDRYLDSKTFIYYEDFSYGNHNWEIRFAEDPYYKANPKSGTFFVDWVDVPLSFEEDGNIEVDLVGKEGYIDLIVDGKSYKTAVLDEGSAEISIDGLDYGLHTYEISYYDTNNIKQLTKSGSFDYTFFMKSNIGDYDPSPFITEFELIIYAPDDITENITVNVDGKIYSVKAVNGTATVTIKDLVVGINNVTISYPGDDKYAAKQLTEELNVFDVFSVIAHWDEEHTKLISFSLNLPANATGNLSVYSGYYDYDYNWVSETLIKSIPLVNGTAVYVNDLKFGRYQLRAFYESDDYDYEVEYSAAYIVITPEVKINDAIVGENATIRIEMPDAEGNITVFEWINHEWELKYTLGPVDDGIFEVNLTGLPLGSYSFKLEYVGDDYTNPFVEWNGDYFETIIYYLQITPNVINIPENFTEDGSGEITLELPEGSTGKVSVYYFNHETGDITPIIYNATYTSENKSLPISGLPVGKHEISVVYVDDNGGMFTKDAMVLVPKSDKGANITIPETITGESFEVTLPSDATGAIIVNIDGTNTYIPLVNGSAKVDVSNLSEGSHNITIKYAGDAKYKGFEKTATVNISKEQPAPTPAPAPVPAKIVAKDLSAFYNKVSYSVTVYGTDGKVAKGVTVVFKIDGKKVGTAKTNAKGIATIILKQVPKTYKITSTALGKSVTKKLTVKQVLTLKKAKVKKSAKKVVLKATLKEGKKALKGKKITFKFKGKKVKTVKTNKKGVAKVAVKKSVLKKLKVGKKVKYQAIYLKDTVTKSVKVKK